MTALVCIALNIASGAFMGRAFAEWFSGLDNTNSLAWAALLVAQAAIGRPARTREAA